MSRDAQVSLQVRNCLRAKVVRKRVCAKRAQVGRAKRAQMGRAKARAIGVAQKGERWRSRVAPRLGVLVPSASLSFLFLSPLSHTLSFLELRRFAEHAPVRSSWFSAGTRTLSARRRTTRSSTTCGEASAARRPHNGCPRSWNTVHRERPLADPVRHNVVLWSST